MTTINDDKRLWPARPGRSSRRPSPPVETPVEFTRDEDGNTTFPAGVTVSGDAGHVTLQPTDVPAPSAPRVSTGVTAGHVYADVEWDLDPEDYGAEHVVGFEVLVLQDGQTLPRTFAAQTGSPVRVEPLDGDAGYTVWVVAVHRLGIKSDPSTSTPFTTPPAPIGLAIPVTQQAADYTFDLDDAYTQVEGTQATAQVFTIPPNSDAAFPVGAWLYARQLDDGQLAVEPGPGVTILSPRGTRTARQYSTMFLIQRAIDEWVISGDTVAVPVVSGVEAVTDGVASTSRVVNVPTAGEPGDLLLIRVLVPSNDNPFGGTNEGPIPEITGATMIRNEGQGLTFPWQWLFWKELGAETTLTVSYKTSGGAAMSTVNAVEIIVVKDADMSNPIDTSSGSSNTDTIPAMSATLPNATLFGFYGSYRSPTHLGGKWSSVPPVEVTNVPAVDTLGVPGMASFIEILTSSGATGSRQATSSGRALAQGVIVNPAP